LTCQQGLVQGCSPRSRRGRQPSVSPRSMPPGSIPGTPVLRATGRDQGVRRVRRPSWSTTVDLSEGSAAQIHAANPRRQE
jgi:hypothetical protein